MRAGAVLAGVFCLSVWLPVSASASGSEVSEPPAPSSPRATLADIFKQQLANLDMLQVQLDALTVHNSKLQSELSASKLALTQLRVTVTELQRQSTELKQNLSQSREAETALQSSLRSSAGLLNRAQASLKRAERNRWVMGAAALAAGAILGGLLL